MKQLFSSFFRIIYAFISGALKVFWRIFSTVFQIIFGNFHWQAPWWLKKLWALLSTIAIGTSRWVIKHIKGVGIAVAALGVCAVAGHYGYQWYLSQQPYEYIPHQPVVQTIEYSVTPPALTSYSAKSASWKPLTIRFKASAAPLEMVGKPITTDIYISPSIKGEWRWSSEKSIQFMPTQDWPIDQTYKVTLPEQDLLAEHTLLEDYQFQFSTKSFNIQKFDAYLYENPEVPEQKKVVTTLRASHPFDQSKVLEHLTIELGKGLFYQDKLASKPEIFFSENGLEAYVHSPLLAMPLEQRRVTIHLNKGLQAQAGGNKISEDIERTVSVPGRYQLSFGDADLIFADNERGEPEQVFLFGSSHAIADENIKDNVIAWLLPTRPNDRSWSYSDVTEDILNKSTLLTIEHIASEAPQNSMHAFKYKAPPGRQIYIIVKPHVESLGGYLSRDTANIALEYIPEFPQQLGFLSDGALLSLQGEKKLGIMSRGISQAKVEISRFLPNQLHHLVNQLDGNFRRPNYSMEESYLDKLVERKTFEVYLPAHDPAKLVYGHVDFTPYLDYEGGRRGIFLLRLTQKEHNPEMTLIDTDETQDLRFIVVTDLGIITKRNVDGSHDVFVQSIAEGTPVNDATVAVYGANGLPVASAHTDESGRVHFDNLDALEREKRPVMYAVSKDDDLSFLPIGEYARRLDFSRFAIDGIRENGKTDTLRAFMFSDRGLYRPGETAQLGMVVRSFDWQSQLGGLPVEVRVIDPRGKLVQESRFNLSKTAFEAVEFTSSPNAPSGVYTAKLFLQSSVRTDQDRLLGHVTFNVRDFEPDRMKVSASLFGAAVQGWIKPEEVQAKVTAIHLFGAPASDRRVITEMRLTPAYTRFKGFEDYHFYWRNSQETEFLEELSENTTNEEGIAQPELNLQRFSANAYQLEILSKVFEADSGRNVAAESRVLVSNEDYLLGVKTQDSLSYISKNAVRKAHWIAITPQLTTRAVEGLTYELTEIRYVSVLVQQNDGTYRYESRRKDQVVETHPVSLSENGFEQTLKTDEPGDFIVYIKKGEQALNQLRYSVAGQGNVARSLDRNAELQLNLSKEVYAPGDEIEISIRAPYTGSGLITIEKDKVYNHVWFKTDATSSVQRIRIPENIEGNAYINVQFVRDSNSEEIFMSPLSYGVMPFQISLDKRRIQVDLKAPEVILPGETLPITVNLNRPGRVVVYGVDQGILQVARYKTPRPLEHFFQKRALEVSSSQILDLILPEFSNLMRASAAGGDQEGALASHLNPFKRKNKPPVVWWSGIVSLPAGESVMEWDVPDYFNGKLHLFAMAVDEQHIGMTETFADVRGPIVLTPNVPAFVAPGDQLRVTTGAFSNLEEQTQVKLMLETDNGFELARPQTDAVDLAAQREVIAGFNIKALEALGSRELTFIAELPDGQRVAIKETISIRPATEHRVTLQLGMFKKKTHEVKIERTLYPEYRNVTTGVAASPIVWSSGLKEYLDNYTHMCTEQLLSKAMPALILGSAENEADVSNFRRATNMLLQRQNSSGGFGVWASTPYADTYVTLYAADFLLEAKERNFKVSDSLLGYVNKFISQVANRTSTDMSEHRNRAYAIYLMTRQGVVASNQLAGLREHLETYYEKQNWQKDLTALYMAASYRLMQQEKQAAELMREQHWMLLDSKWSSDSYYLDPLTHDAQYLHLLSKHFPEQLRKIPQELLINFGHRLTEKRYNSLSSALTLRALSSYEMLASQNVSMSVNAQLAADTAQQLTMEHTPPYAAVPIAAQALLFEKTDTQTPGFYMFTESGYDKVIPEKAVVNGLEIIHDFLDLKGNPVQEVAVGDELLVRIRVRAVDEQAQHQVAIVDLLPGGMEPVYYQAPLNEDDDADDSASTSWKPPVGEPAWSDWNPDFIDLRDDRVLIYGQVDKSISTFTYRIRAINAGSFITPPAFVESMYDPTAHGQSIAGTMNIVDP